MGPFAEFPGRRRTDRHAAVARGRAVGRCPVGPGRLPPLEARFGRGTGTPDAGTARPPLLPQGSLPLPFLRPGGRHPPRPRLAWPCPLNRPAPPRPAPVDAVALASERPGAAAVFVRG